MESLKTLLILLLADNDEFSSPIISGRVKRRDECIAKFKLKYLSKLEQTEKPYEIKNYITDIIGLRVVCLYESDIPKVKDIISSNFEVISETDKSKSIEEHDDLFGYKGLHLDLKLNGARLALPEYKNFTSIQFELQIRTTIQDAWSTLDHKIKYKKNIPHNLKRRINRLAALFELADQEFMYIRDETQQLEQAQSVASNQVDVSTATQVAQRNKPLDVFSFTAFAQNEFIGYKFEGYKVDGFIDEIKSMSGEISTEELTHKYEEGKKIVSEYKSYQATRHVNRMNPYTMIRHALYFNDKKKFSELLFDMQRKNFDEWLAAHVQE